ncbi:metallophosphoesterase [Roseobacteraceae bacterium S113]
MFRTFVSSLLSQKPQTLPFDAPLRPETGCIVIGDIHGRFDLLTRLLQELPSDFPIVCVGDYVDRGDNSADVLQFLLEHDEITCLQGNHEAMLLSFLENPAKAGPGWLKYGGLQTLASFGIGGLSAQSGKEALELAARQLAEKMGPDLISWIKNLPLLYVDGNVAVVHAAADPHHPISQQQKKTLLWGHADFETTPRADEMWVVHGHTIVNEAHAIRGRISVDTGAYATGRLSSALVFPETVLPSGLAFITT